jgi:5-hydroxyisourate hydrolase
MSRPILSSHVLDTSNGRPAAGLFVELYKKKDDKWVLWHNTMTNSDGRMLFPFTSDSMEEGTYKLYFKVGDYFKCMDKETFYPYVEVSSSCFKASIIIILYMSLTKPTIVSINNSGYICNSNGLHRKYYVG